MVETFAEKRRGEEPKREAPKPQAASILAQQVPVKMVQTAMGQQQRAAEQIFGAVFDNLKSGIPKNAELRGILS